MDTIPVGQGYDSLSAFLNQETSPTFTSFIRQYYTLEQHHFKILFMPLTFRDAVVNIAHEGKIEVERGLHENYLSVPRVDPCSS